jgi:hypothetical protein
MFVSTVSAGVGTGFDEFGYNRKARIFVGTGESWAVEQGLPANYLAPFDHDKIVMKWNAEWDRGNAEGWTDDYYAAWCTNQWNGNVPGGSGVMETVKVIWVGELGEASDHWRPGGYLIWGIFEVTMDHYTGDWASYSITASWMAKATPNGLGGI